MYLELDTNLTPEQKQLKLEAHRFAAEVLRPASIELDKLPDPADVIDPGSAFWDVMRKGYELGYHTRAIPKQFGGLGLSPLENHIVLEEMAWGSVDLAVSLTATVSPFGLAVLSQNQRMIEEHVAPYVNDRKAAYIGCWAMTEPLHGSDTLLSADPGVDPYECFSLVARWDGGAWVVDGQKAAWVSNGTIATHAMAMLAVDGPSGRGGGIAFIPLDLPGVSKGKPWNKLGQRALNQGEIFFDGVRIPKEYMVIEPPFFQAAMNSTLGGANAAMSVCALGIAQAAFEEALAYAKARVQGGKVICRHQLIQKKLFDMFMKVESARSFSRAAMVYNASARDGSGVAHCVAAKVYCSQVAFEVAHEAVQIFGGMGLSREMLVEKLFRDARATLIEDGANDTLALAGAARIIGAP